MSSTVVLTEHPNHREHMNTFAPSCVVFAAAAIFVALSASAADLSTNTPIRRTESAA
ncbi:MAG: hypothetical protein ACK45Y_07290 [Betaproteobacteria bacterium]